MQDNMNPRKEMLCKIYPEFCFYQSVDKGRNNHFRTGNSRVISCKKSKPGRSPWPNEVDVQVEIPISPLIKYCT